MFNKQKRIKMVQVKNVIGSSRFPHPAGYTSWLDYWEKQTGCQATHCFALDCRKWTNGLVGAHVQKVDSLDKHYYIVPLCEPCNHRTDAFWVDESALVPVPSNL